MRAQAPAQKFRLVCGRRLRRKGGFRLVCGRRLRRKDGFGFGDRRRSSHALTAPVAKRRVIRQFFSAVAAKHRDPSCVLRTQASADTIYYRSVPRRCQHKSRVLRGPYSANDKSRRTFCAEEPSGKILESPVPAACNRKDRRRFGSPCRFWRQTPRVMFASAAFGIHDSFVLLCGFPDNPAISSSVNLP